MLISYLKPLFFFLHTSHNTGFEAYPNNGQGLASLCYIYILHAHYCIVCLLYSAPHVDPEFITNCRMQKRVHSNIRCEENGSFSEIQCMGDICFCADTITGRRINDEFFSMDQADNVTCSSGQYTCGKLRARLNSTSFQ